MRAERRRQADLGWRLAVVVGASATAATGAATLVAATLSTVAAFATVQWAVRRRRDPAEAVLVGTAGLLMVLVVLGLALDRLPTGLTRTSWALGAGAAAAATLVTGWVRHGRHRAPPRPSGALRWSARLRGAGWALACAAIVAAALGISVHASRLADRSPVQLSLVGRPGEGVALIQVDAGRSAGQFELHVDGADPVREIGPFRLAPGGQRRYRVQLPTSSPAGIANGTPRTTRISLTRIGSAVAIRSLLLDRKA